MLKAFRNASNSWFIKILFGAIILSFCFWGIGDIIRNYSASKSVVTVGKVSVNSETFSREYNQARQKIRNAGQRALTDLEMQNIDVKSLVLDKMIDEAVLDQTCLNYGLTISKKSIGEVIHSIPEFQKDGVFNGAIFSTILQRSGIPKSAFVQNIRNNLSRTQLLHPIVVGYEVPKFVKDIITKEFETKKTLVFGYIKLSDIKDSFDITDDDLAEYYNSNKDQYKKPEMRDISVLVIDYTKHIADIEVTQKEIDEYYEANKDAFAPRELRNFQRLTFKTAANADKAWEMLKRGSSVNEIVKLFIPNIEEVNDMDQQSFPKEVGKELFSLKKEGDVSVVYHIGDLFYVYRLTKVSKIGERTKEEINQEIKNILQNEKMNTPEFYQSMKEIRNKIDDGFGAGKDISEIAKETGMQIVSIKDVTVDTENPEIASLATDKPTIDDIKEAIFSTPEKQASQIIESRELDTLSFVVWVDKVTPEYIPEMNSIKTTVKEDYIKSRKDEMAKKKADEILDANEKAVSSFANSFKAGTYTISKRDIIMYQTEQANNVTQIMKIIPNLNVVLDLISTLHKGEAKYFVNENGDYLLVGLKETTNPKTNDIKFSSIVDRYIDNSLKKDIPQISMVAFKNQLKITVDEKLIKKITSSVDDEESKN